jgi:hypothetical protein
MGETTQLECLGQYQGCGFRIWELGANCDIPDPSAAIAYNGQALARANMTVELKEGQEVEATTACGSVAFAVKDNDRIKGWNVELELILWDYEILEAVVGGTLITGGSSISPSSWRDKTIGWAAPGPDSTDQPAVAVELWSRTASDTGACGAVGADTPLFIRHIWPRAQLQLQDRSFEDGQAAYMKFSGFVGANPKLFPRLASLGESHDGEGWLGQETVTNLASSTYVQMYSNSVPTQPSEACSYTEYDLTA